MRVFTRRAGLLAGLATLVSRPGHAACAAPLTVVPVENANGRCVLTVSLNGQDMKMILDTGAERTVLTRAAVARHRLPLDAFVGTTLRGADGRLDTHRNARVRSLSVGGVGLYQREVNRPLSLAVTAMDLGDIAGLLGGDLLRRHGLDLDILGGRLALLAADDCPAFVAESVPLQLLRPNLLLVPVTLDGLHLTALLDTGSTSSLVNARGLYKLGLSPARIAQDPVSPGLALGGRFEAHRHPFDTLRVGSMVLANPRVFAINVPEPAFDLLLGLDVLGRQRMFLSYANLKLSLGQ